MNTPTKILFSTFALAGALSSPAMAQADSGEEAYRRAVLGNSSIGQPAAADTSPRIAERVQPGSYAKYLIYLGRDKDDALEAASRIGEQPVRQTLRITPQRLTSTEAHERYLGGATRPDVQVEILAEERIDAPAASTRVARSNTPAR